MNVFRAVPCLLADLSCCRYSITSCVHFMSWITAVKGLSPDGERKQTSSTFDDHSRLATHEKIKEWNRWESGYIADSKCLEIMFARKRAVYGSLNWSSCQMTYPCAKHLLSSTPWSRVAVQGEKRKQRVDGHSNGADRGYCALTERAWCREKPVIIRFLLLYRSTRRSTETLAYVYSEIIKSYEIV